MAAYEVLLLNTAIPQIQAAQSGDTYVVPRDIAFSTVANLANGTNLLPSLTFSSDTNTGIYREGADALGFTAGGGTNQMVLTTTGLGIGTNNPAYKLDVNGTGSIISATRSDTNRADIIVTNSGGTVSFGINNSTGSWLTNGLPYYGYILGPSNASYGLQFGVGASNTAAVTIDPSGNLGLGVTPSAWDPTMRAFQVANVGAHIAAGMNNFSGAQQLFIGNNSHFNSSGQHIYARTNPAALYRQLDNSHLWFNAPSGTAGDPISFTQAMTLDASGNLVVGATSTAYRMEVVAPSGDNVSALFRSGDATAANNAGGGFRSISSATAASRVAQVWLDADGANLSGGDYFYIQKNGNSGTADIVQYSNSAMTFATNAAERARITSGGDFQTSSGNSVMVGGTAARATTAGTNRVDIFDGTAPVGTLANGVSFYSASGEANVMDAAGNATLLSPHDAETNEWIFRSKHTPTGKVLKIDVERLLKFVNDHFGLDAVHEFVEK